MEQMHIAILGGTSTLATKVIIPECLKFNNVHIRATFHKKKPTFTHERISWIQADLSKPGWHPELMDGVPYFRFGFHTAVYGYVGFPCAEAEDEQISETFIVSVQPLLELEKTRRFHSLVAFGHLPTDLTSQVYGAMEEAKGWLRANWLKSHQHGDVQKYLINAGVFPSDSARRIVLALYAQLKKRKPGDYLVKLFGGLSRPKLEEKLLALQLDQERRVYGAEYMVSFDQVREAIRLLFVSPKHQVITVVGGKPLQFSAA